MAKVWIPDEYDEYGILETPGHYEGEDDPIEVVTPPTRSIPGTPTVEDPVLPPVPAPANGEWTKDELGNPYRIVNGSVEFKDDKGTIFKYDTNKGGFVDEKGNLAGGGNSSLVNAIKNFFTKPNGDLDLSKIGLIGGGIAGAVGAGTATTKPTGYQGGIPNLVATQPMLTEPPPGRRPGSGGINYGTGVQYKDSKGNIVSDTSTSVADLYKKATEQGTFNQWGNTYGNTVTPVAPTPFTFTPAAPRTSAAPPPPPPPPPQPTSGGIANLITSTPQTNVNSGIATGIDPNRPWLKASSDPIIRAIQNELEKLSQTKGTPEERQAVLNQFLHTTKYTPAQLSAASNGVFGVQDFIDQMQGNPNVFNAQTPWSVYSTKADIRGVQDALQKLSQTPGDNKTRQAALQNFLKTTNYTPEQLSAASNGMWSVSDLTSQMAGNPVLKAPAAGSGGNTSGVIPPKPPTPSSLADLKASYDTLSKSGGKQSDLNAWIRAQIGSGMSAKDFSSITGYPIGDIQKAIDAAKNEGKTSGPDTRKGVVAGPGSDNRPTVDYGLKSQGYSRDYSPTDIQNIRGTWIQSKGDPKATAAIMSKYGVTAKDIALVIGEDPAAITRYFMNGGVEATNPILSQTPANDQQKQYLAWQGEQVNPVTGKKIKEEWAARGITDPTKDPSLVAGANQALTNAENREALGVSSATTRPWSSTVVSSTQAPAPKTATDWANSPEGKAAGGLPAMYTNIKSFLATNPSQADITAMMQKYGVDPATLQAAKDYNPNVVVGGGNVTPPVTAAPKTAAEWANTPEGQKAGGIASVYGSLKTYLATNPSATDLQNMMQTYGVTPAILQQAKDYNPNVVVGGGIVTPPAPKAPVVNPDKPWETASSDPVTQSAQAALAKLNQTPGDDKTRQAALQNFLKTTTFTPEQLSAASNGQWGIVDLINQMAGNPVVEKEIEHYKPMEDDLYPPKAPTGGISGKEYYHGEPHDDKDWVDMYDLYPPKAPTGGISEEYYHGEPIDDLYPPKAPTGWPSGGISEEYYHGEPIDYFQQIYNRAATPEEAQWASGQDAGTIQNTLTSALADWQSSHPMAMGGLITRHAQGGLTNLDHGGFVIPADVVSHFGNGSSSAGLELLAQNMGAKPIRGQGDGMSDSIPAAIDGREKALVANDEAYLSPQMVQRLGDGNMDAGSQKLARMMEKIRQARTGSKEQGKQIDPNKFMPGGMVGYAQGGGIKSYAGTTDPTASLVQAGVTGTEQNLSNWVGPYATQMLGQTQALANTPYQAYTGPLTAGVSGLQNLSFENAANLSVPSNVGYAGNQMAQIGDQAQKSSYDPATFGNQFQAPTLSAATDFTNQFQAPTPYQYTDFTAGTFDSDAAQQYMNPYLQQFLNPQLEEARRQSEITNQQNNAAMTKAGAFGGGRQAILTSENQRNLATNQANITGQGYNTAYTNAMNQFNSDQARNMQAQQAAEQSRQFGANQSMTAAQMMAQYGMSAQQAQEAARQFNQQQNMNSALSGAQYGLAGQQAGEQSRQFGANYGNQNLNTALQSAQGLGNLGIASGGLSLQNLQQQAALGGVQRGIESEGLAADRSQFEEARKDPYTKLQFQQSMLNGLPITATNYNMSQPNALQGAAGGARTINDLLKALGYSV